VTASSVTVVSASEIDATFAVATTASNSVSVSATANGVPSDNSVSFVPQHPRLQVHFDTSQTIAAGCSISFVERFVTYFVVDRNLDSITTPVAEQFVAGPSTNSCGNGPAAPTLCTAPTALSEFTDRLTVGCNSVGGSCGYSLTNEWSSCPTGGASVPMGSTSWTIQNSSTSVLIGGVAYTLPGGSMIPIGTIITP